MEDKNNGTMFKPTVEWIRENYGKLNNELFGGNLGGCSLGLFTTGRGSHGKILSHFRMNTNGLKAERSSRRMFKF